MLLPEGKVELTKVEYPPAVVIQPMRNPDFFFFPYFHPKSSGDEHTISWRMNSGHCSNSGVMGERLT
jgi:hypothetical protein